MTQVGIASIAVDPGPRGCDALKAIVAKVPKDGRDNATKKDSVILEEMRIVCL